MDWTKTGGRKQVGRKQVGRKLGARARLYPRDGLFCLNTFIGFTATMKNYGMPVVNCSDAILLHDSLPVIVMITIPFSSHLRLVTLFSSQNAVVG